MAFEMRQGTVYLEKKSGRRFILVNHNPMALLSMRFWSESAESAFNLAAPEMISIDELISEIRQTGLSSIAEVDYAILEQNGKISVIPRKSAQPPTAADLGLHITESGIVHAIIEDGVINRYNLDLLSLGEGWLRARLAEKALAASEVFFLGIDDSGSLYWIEREEQI